MPPGVFGGPGNGRLDQSHSCRPIRTWTPDALPSPTSVTAAPTPRIVQQRPPSERQPPAIVGSDRGDGRDQRLRGVPTVGQRLRPTLGPTTPTPTPTSTRRERRRQPRRHRPGGSTVVLSVSALVLAAFGGLPTTSGTTTAPPGGTIEAGASDWFRDAQGRGLPALSAQAVAGMAPRSLGVAYFIRGNVTGSVEAFDRGEPPKSATKAYPQSGATWRGKVCVCVCGGGGPALAEPTKVTPAEPASVYSIPHPSGWLRLEVTKVHGWPVVGGG